MRGHRIVAVAVCGALVAGCTGGDSEDSHRGAPATTIGEASADGRQGLPAIVADVEPSVVTVFVGRGLGSGVVFRRGGLVLTNQHVVGDATSVQLGLADGSRIPARVAGTDAITDLAVIRADRDLPPVRFRTDLPLPGETVLAMGSPLGFRNSVTLGIVSGVGREIPGSAEQTRALVDLIQTDAAISPGNSGGPLVDRHGRVVGINDAYIPPQSGAVSLGFAIPAATAVQVAEDLLDDGRVTHPYVGISPGRLTPDIAERLGVPVSRGVLVRAVEPGGPADAAGVRAADVLTELGGERTETLEAFFGALRKVQSGQQVEIRYRRGEQTGTATVTVGSIKR